MQGLTYASVCDGIGASHVAWQGLPFRCLWVSEIEAFPNEVVRLRWGHRNLGDMTKITEEMIADAGRPDVLVGGTPCQSFSVAGLRAGLDDPRGQLTLRFVQLAAVMLPKWIVWENVPGVLSSGRGRDFGSFIGALAELGYGCCWRSLDAQYFGLAQRRKRVFVVGHLGDWRRAAAVLLEPDCMRGDPPPSRPPRKGAAADAGCGTAIASWPRDIAPCLDASYGSKQGLDNQHQTNGFGLFVPCSNAAIASHDPACCLTARDLKGPLPEADLSTAVMEPFVKAKRSQSSADDESWKEGEVSPTLNRFDVGDTRATTVVAFTQNQRDEVRGLGDTAGTLNGPGTHQSTYVAEAFSVREDAKAGNFSATPTNVGLAVQSHQPSVQSHHAQIFVAEEAVAFKPSHYTRGKDGAPSAVAPPLSADADRGDQDTLVAHTSDGVVADPITATEGKSWTNEGNSFRLRNCVQQTMAVRRLTPIECERLQGFPDGYTQIPWRKKPVEQCPDGPRYRAIGNSMAVPVMRWIGERIAAMQEVMDDAASVC